MIDESKLRRFMPGSGHGGEIGQFATIGTVGQLSISWELCERIDFERMPCVMVFGYERCLVLRPTDDTRKTWRWDKHSKGKMRRITCIALLKSLGITPKEKVRCRAWWDGPYIVVDVSPLLPGEETTKGPPLVAGHDSRATSHEPRAADDGPTCESCSYQRAALCTRGIAPDDRRHKRVDGPPWKAACAEYKRRKSSPPSPAIAEPRPRATGHELRALTRGGQRPKSQCPECGHLFAVSGRGLLPHDRDGKAFQAGGNKSKRCPGSNRQVER